MKKVIIILSVIFLTGCYKDDFAPVPPVALTPDLKIESLAGIKLQSAFVTSEVAMNIKVASDDVITVKILDIANRVVSKEVMSVKAGDNILKVYTSALPSSAYRIGIYDVNNNMLGITDFNKL